MPVVWATATDHYNPACRPCGGAMSNSSLARRLEKLEADAPNPCPDLLHAKWRIVYDESDWREPGERADPGPANCPTCGQPRDVIRVEYVKKWPDGPEDKN